MASYQRIQIENWLKTIDVKADRVLDIGGSQLPIKGRTKSWDVKDYKILDLEEPHENNAPADIIFDINKPFEGKIILNDFNFDVAFCIEVSEYWYDPWEAIDNIYKMLKDRGILYITFTFIYGYHKPEGTDLLRYTPVGAERLLKEARFEILEHIYKKTNGDLLEKFWLEEKMKVLPVFRGVVGSMIKARKI